jgi:LDH2 family malate/lactate/ureidoglycolate dehydrogenase
VDGTTYGQWWQSTESTVTVRIEDLERIGQAAFESAGATPEDAAFLFSTMLNKSLQGDHSRGVIGLPAVVDRVRRGELDVAPTIEVVRETTATAVVDGGPHAHGQLVCRFAMDLAIAKAREHGVGWVGARSWGLVLKIYAEQAAKAGMVGMSMVQSFPAVAPFGGFEPLLGNGPIAFGIPAENHDPVILDMCMTQTSASGVILAARQGQHVPPGFILDRNGDPTTDATEFADLEKMARGPSALTTGPSSTIIAAKGTLVPLGDSHKAYALMFVIGLLSMLLTDTSPPWDLFYETPGDGRYGTILVAIDPDAFDPSGEAPKKVDAFIDRLAEAGRIEGVDEILYPGQRSQALKHERRASGKAQIPLSHIEAMRRTASELGIDPPAEIG